MPSVRTNQTYTMDAALLRKSTDTVDVVDVSAGSQSLSSYAERLELTGTLTATTTITLPTTSAPPRLIKNSTLGDYGLWIKRGSSGKPLQILRNETVEVL